MNAPKLSEWFDATTHTPGSVGVYERKLSDAEFVAFQHWNGKVWGQYCGAPRQAAKFAGCPSAQQGGKFRGTLK